MVGLGTLVNSGAILAGAGAGLLLRRGLPEKWQESIMQGVALCIIVIGVQMAFKSENIMVVIFSIVLGAIVGEGIDIDTKLQRFGDWIGSKLIGGHDAGEFIRLIREGMDPENSIAGMQKRYETGDREADFLRRYITTLGGGYRFDKIPAVLDELCRKNGETVNEEDWQLIRRYLSDPSSYTFHFVAKHRELFTAYIAPEELEAWIQKVLYVPVFNTVNSLVFDEKEYDAERFKTLRKDIKIVRPERKSYLLSILDYYDAFRMDKMDKVLSIFKKQFMSLPASDRWGLTMQLNAMLCAKGNKAQCEEGLHIFRQLFNPVDPILKNFENALNKRIGSL